MIDTRSCEIAALEGVVVEISTYEIEQPFKTLICYQSSFMALNLTDIARHFQYSIFSFADFSYCDNPGVITVAFVIFFDGD